MTAPLVGLITCVFPFTVIGSGVLNENFFFASVSRGVRQSTSPVFLFNATMNGSLAPSQLKMSALPTRIGEPPLPCTGGYFSDVFRQITLPLRSSAAVPYGPK